MSLKCILDKIDLPYADRDKALWNIEGTWLVTGSCGTSLCPRGNGETKYWDDNIVEASNWGQVMRYVELMKEERFGYNCITIMNLCGKSEEGNDVSVATFGGRFYWMEDKWITEDEWQLISYEEYKKLHAVWSKEWIILRNNRIGELRRAGDENWWKI